MNKQLTIEYEYPFDLEVSEPKIIPRIVYDAKITIEGIEEDLFDVDEWIYETNDRYLEQDDFSKMLMNKEILISLGNRHTPMQTGPNFDKFKKLIETKVKEARKLIKEEREKTNIK